MIGHMDESVLNDDSECPAAYTPRLSYTGGPVPAPIGHAAGRPGRPCLMRLNIARDSKQKSVENCRELEG